MYQKSISWSKTSAPNLFQDFLWVPWRHYSAMPRPMLLEKTSQRALSGWCCNASVCHYSVFARIGHQRFRTHRQPVAFALVPGSLSSYGEGVRSKIPCTQVFWILHCHRCGTRLQASTKIEHKNTSTKALFHTHLQERTDKQEVIRFGQPPFYRVVQNDFLYTWFSMTWHILTQEKLSKTYNFGISLLSLHCPKLRFLHLLLT